MVFVAIVALNFTAIRVVMDHSRPTSDLLGLGVLPMANILAVGLLIGHRRRGSRPFLLGFETFGAAALALYVVLASCLRDETVIPYLNLALDPLIENIIGRFPLFVFIPIAYSVATVLLALPQMVLALIGGFLSREYRITITRRPPRVPADR
jgi:hypothetical protein